MIVELTPKPARVLAVVLDGVTTLDSDSQGGWIGKPGDFLVIHEDGTLKLLERAAVIQQYVTPEGAAPDLPLPPAALRPMAKPIPMIIHKGATP